jgi:hypothetical protein
MKTLFRLIVWALALAATPWALSQTSDAMPSKTKGHVILLENERTVQGQIELEGNQYRVRREVGETMMPAAHVIFLADDLEEAYAFLRSRANLRDADERLRLARWCHLHGLKKQALDEATAAVELRPKNAEAQRLFQSMQRSAGTAPSAPAAPINKETSDPAAIEVSAESLGQFISKVQPILMNTCTSCHVADHAGTFKLTRAQEGGVVNRRATQRNLNAVLAHINREHWETSAFLVKAVSMHGQASQPPLKSRQSPAFKSLEDWVRAAMADNPQFAQGNSPFVLAAAVSDPKATARTEPTKPGSAAPEKSSATPGASTETLVTNGPAPVVPNSTKPASPGNTKPAKPSEPVDPFDPIIFNRQMHPERNGGESP